WQPPFGFVLFAAPYQCREVVKEQHLGIANLRIDPSLPLACGKVWQSDRAQVRNQNPKVVVSRRLWAEARDNCRKAFLHRLRRHLAMDIEYLGRPLDGEAEKARASGDRVCAGHSKQRLADPARRIDHHQAFLEEPWREDFLSRREF